MLLEDPAPTIRLNQLADSAVVFVCRPWARPQDYWDVYWDITRSVKARFDAENIGIPFPQRDIHVHFPEQQASRAAELTGVSASSHA